jgi:hypothetical protein
MGQAIKGVKIEQELPIEPIVETSWNDWKKLYPNTVVLSRDTGYFRDYDSNPYSGYDTRSDIWFPTSYISDLEPYNLYFEKDLTLVLKIKDNVTLFPFKELIKEPILNKNFQIFHQFEPRDLNPLSREWGRNTSLNL